MNTVDLVQYSLGFAFNVLDQLVSDLTQEQADWMPPGNVNPISALYWHTISYVDITLHDWAMGKPPLKQTAGWQEKVLTACPPPVEGDPMGELRAIREGVCIDLAAMHEYAHALSKDLLDWLGSLTPEDLDRTMETVIGELTTGQMLEAFAVWHITAHCGEISTIRGLQGLKGYPW